MSTENPTPDSSVQQSLNLYSDTLIIQKYCRGGAKNIVDEMPTEDDTRTVREKSSEVGKTNREFPVKRDHCTVSLCNSYRNFPTSTGIGKLFKQFDVEIDRETNPEDAKRIEALISALRELPAIKEEISEYETYDDVVSNSNTIRRYEALYNTMKKMWAKDSLKSFVVVNTARDFKVRQFSQGFFLIPAPHHDTVREILADKLGEEDLGKDSVSWGGFIVEPSAFTPAYDIVKPAYHTPENDAAFSIDTDN
jgi:hypothetical protein